MKQRALLSCLSFLLASYAAVAAPPQEGSAVTAAAAPLAPGQSDVALNVSGGRYQQVDMPLAENDEGAVELTLAHAHRNRKWAPLANVCVQADPHSDQVCLRFHVTAYASKDLQLKYVVVAGNGKAMLASEDLPGKFRIGDTIKIGLRVSPGSVQFRIGEAAPIIKKLSFTSRVLRFGCSSALCRFRLT
jgi:hypothetical protein